MAFSTQYRPLIYRLKQVITKEKTIVYPVCEDAGQVEGVPRMVCVILGKIFTSLPNWDYRQWIVNPDPPYL